MKTTFERIRKFNIFGASVKNRHKQSKISYAIIKVANKLKMLSEYNEHLEDISIDHCNTDKEDVIIYDITKDNGKETRHFQFKKEKHKIKVKEERELLKNWDVKEFDIEPFFCKEIPNDITAEEHEALEGFIIKEVATIKAKESVRVNGEN